MFFENVIIVMTGDSEKIDGSIAKKALATPKGSVRRCQIIDFRGFPTCLFPDRDSQWWTMGTVLEGVALCIPECDVPVIIINSLDQWNALRFMDCFGHIEKFFLGDWLWHGKDIGDSMQILVTIEHENFIQAEAADINGFLATMTADNIFCAV